MIIRQKPLYEYIITSVLQCLNRENRKTIVLYDIIVDATALKQY